MGTETTLCRATCYEVGVFLGRRETALLTATTDRRLLAQAQGHQNAGMARVAHMALNRVAQRLAPAVQAPGAARFETLLALWPQHAGGTQVLLEQL